MGYVFDLKDGIAYEQWLNRSENRIPCELQTELIKTMLDPKAGESVLDIGCGSGIRLMPLLETGINLTGLDASPYMIDMAAKNLEHRSDLYCGCAEDLPFDDNAFDYAIILNTLEFVENPYQTIAEACRVAKNKIFISALNPFSMTGMRLRIRDFFSETIYHNAQFYSLWHIIQMIHSNMGNIPITWRTIGQLPLFSYRYSGWLERRRLTQKCPLGMFIVIAATLKPRYRTRPLELRYMPKQQGRIFTSATQTIRR